MWMIRSWVALSLLLTGCESKKSEGEVTHEKEQGRATEIAQQGIQKWTSLVDQALAATAGDPPPDKATALAAIAKAKEEYLAWAKPLREEVNAGAKSNLGQVSREISQFQNSDDYKKKVELVNERARAYGDDGREVGAALRELMNYQYVYAVHSEK